jgi:hypothetical protein
MPYPDDYRDIAAHKDSVQKARKVKEQLGLTWSDFLKRGAMELANNE